MSERTIQRLLIVGWLLVWVAPILFIAGLFPAIDGDDPSRRALGQLLILSSVVCFLVGIVSVIIAGLRNK